MYQNPSRTNSKGRVLDDGGTYNLVLTQNGSHLVVKHYFASQRGHRLIASGSRDAMLTAQRLMNVETVS